MNIWLDSLILLMITYSACLSPLNSHEAFLTFNQIVTWALFNDLSRLLIGHHIWRSWSHGSAVTAVRHKETLMSRTVPPKNICHLMIKSQTGLICSSTLIKFKTASKWRRMLNPTVLLESIINLEFRKNCRAHPEDSSFTAKDLTG